MHEFSTTGAHVRPLRTTALGAACKWTTALRALCTLSALLLLLFLALPIHAQFGSSLSGTVVDASGAAMQGATVTLTNKATGQTATVTTNGTGFYHFGELPPGSYTLVITAQGFKKNQTDNVGLAAETPRNVNVSMVTGGDVETV